MSAKIKTLQHVCGAIRFRDILKYYWIRECRKNSSREYRFHLKNGLVIDANPKNGDLCTLYEIFIRQDYAPRYRINRSDVAILDIGANVGFFSLYASRLYPGGRIYAFEPHGPTYQRLMRHLTLNHTRAIKPFQLAVSDSQGAVDFFCVEWTGINTLIPGKLDTLPHDVQRVECIPFLSIFEMTGEKEFDFAKIDCEGSEYQIILKSEDAAIRRVKEYVIEVHPDTRFQPADLVARFRNLGYATELTDVLLRAKRTTD